MIAVRVRPRENVQSAMIRALGIFFGGDDTLVAALAWIQPTTTKERRR